MFLNASKSLICVVGANPRIRKYSLGAVEKNIFVVIKNRRVIYFVFDERVKLEEGRFLRKKKKSFNLDSGKKV